AGVEEVVAAGDAGEEAVHTALVEGAGGVTCDHDRRRIIVGRADEGGDLLRANDSVRVAGRVGTQRLVVRIGAISKHLVVVLGEEVVLLDVGEQGDETGVVHDAVVGRVGGAATTVDRLQIDLRSFVVCAVGAAGDIAAAGVDHGGRQ